MSANVQFCTRLCVLAYMCICDCSKYTNKTVSTCVWKCPATNECNGTHLTGFIHTPIWILFLFLSFFLFRSSIHCISNGLFHFHPLCMYIYTSLSCAFYNQNVNVLENRFFLLSLNVYIVFILHRIARCYVYWVAQLCMCVCAIHASKTKQPG